MLGPKEIAALNALYKIYRTKKRVERKVIEQAFYYATGKRLGAKYYAIEIVRKLLELSS